MKSKASQFVELEARDWEQRATGTGKGKPIWETELWVSDELAALAAQLLKVDKDRRTGIEGRSELLEIRREEPYGTLFDIPQDYQINPKLPPTMISGAPESAKD